jgi:hypothetical protein
MAHVICEGGHARSEIHRQTCALHKQQEVRAGEDRQMDVGVLRSHGAPRISTDDGRVGMEAFALADSFKNWLMTFVRVGADDEKAVSKIGVRVAAGRLILAEGLHVPERGRRHAKARIPIHIVGSNARPEQLICRVRFLRKKLAGTPSAFFGDDCAQSPERRVQSGRQGIFSLRMRYAKVVRFIPSRVAAPLGPPITHFD